MLRKLPKTPTRAISFIRVNVQHSCNSDSIATFTWLAQTRILHTTAAQIDPAVPTAWTEGNPMVRSRSKPGSRLTSVVRRASLLATLTLCGGVTAAGVALTGPAAEAASPASHSTFVVGDTGAVDGMNPYVGFTNIDFEVYGL